MSGSRSAMIAARFTPRYMSWRHGVALRSTRSIRTRSTWSSYRAREARANRGRSHRPSFIASGTGDRDHMPRRAVRPESPVSHHPFRSRIAPGRRPPRGARVAVRDRDHDRRGDRRRRGRPRGRVPRRRQAVRAGHRPQDRARARASPARRRGDALRPACDDLLGCGPTRRRRRRGAGVDHGRPATANSSPASTTTLSSGSPSCSASAASSPRRSATWSSVSCPIDRGRRRRDDRRPRHAAPARRVPRRARRSTGRPSIDALVGLARGRRAGARHPFDRPQPADPRRRQAGRGRRPARGGRRLEVEAERRHGGGAVSHDLSALFDPKGIIITGVSNHPGKFGFVTLHNLLASGYEGDDLPGRPRARRGTRPPACSARSTRCPTAQADMVFICTPRPSTRTCCGPRAAKGVTAAFFAAAGYREAGPDGVEAERRLVALADELGHRSRRAQRAGRGLHPVEDVRPDRGALRPGRPHRRRQPVGQLRVVVPEPRPPHGRRRQPRRCRRQRRRTRASPTIVEWFADDPETRVCLVYMESVDNGREMFERLRGGGRAQAGGGGEGRRVRRRGPSRGAATPAPSPPTTRSSTACVARPA